MQTFVTPAGVIAAGFDKPLDLRAWVPGEWLVLAPMPYRSLGGRMFVVPGGFITDLASIPQVAQAILPIDDETRMPAVLHDWLYCVQETSRRQADDLFHEALLRAGVNPVKARTMWSAVRVGGWRYWNKRDGLTEEDFAQVAAMAE